jgi:hypothetical protein
LSTSRGNRVGSEKKFIITPGTLRETLLATPLTLPTAEPATAQISFTIQETDLPTISPKVPMQYFVNPVVSGKVGAAASTIAYRILKNGANVATITPGASAAATQFWTHNHWRLPDVKVGDVIDIKYWAAQADVTLDFYGLVVYPSQPEVAKRGAILRKLTFSNPITAPNFVTAFTVNNTAGYYLNPTTPPAYNVIATNTNHPFEFPTIEFNSTYGLFRHGVGEGNGLPQTAQYANATTRQQQKNWFPQNISFREIRIG